MSFRVVDARHVHDFVLWLKFNDGTEGELDLRDELDGPIFEPLTNIEFFKQFRIDPDLHTLVCPNGPILRLSFSTSISDLSPHIHKRCHLTLMMVRV